MKKLYKKFKRRVFSILSVRMVYKGYVIRAAMRWKRSVVSNFFRDHNTNIFYKIRSYMLGYMPYQRKIFNITGKNKKQFLSYKKYLYLNGSNGKYSKWLADIITTDQVLKKFRGNMPKLYYHMYNRDGMLKIISLQKDLVNTENEVINFIKSQKHVKLLSSNYMRNYDVIYKDNSLYIEEVPFSDSEFIAFIKNELSEVRSLVIKEHIEVDKDFYIDNIPARMFLKVYNKDGVTPTIGEMYCTVGSNYNIDNEFGIEELDEAYLDVLTSSNDEEDLASEDTNAMVYYNEKTGAFKTCFLKKDNKTIIFNKMVKNAAINKLVKNNFEAINKLVVEIFKTIPQIELAGVELAISKDGIKIINIFNNPSYCSYVYFNKDFDEFLKYKYVQKRELYKSFSFKFSIFKRKVYLKVCKLFAKLCYPKGLIPYLSFRWLKDVKNDFVENKKIPFHTKMWAYRHGFLSYRLAQYGITKKNYKNFISDFEYRWLRHIDNYYKTWFEDKVTIKYVASEYNQFFPKYYYYIGLKQGENKLIPLMDCPKGYGDSYEDIFNLVKKEKEIALKRDKGSHGDGFYRLSYKNNKFYLNLEEATKQDVIDILSDKNNEYLVTEYIKQHKVLNDIYDGSVNTIRIIVYKKDGVNPTIGNTYMRFGTAKTGTVDNITAGGLSVEIDSDTGRFHDALMKTEDLKIIPCDRHPDTNALIEGYIPNWDQILKDIKEIAYSLEQIEYFGFDIAVTEDGMKFPEINRYPDYMGIGKLKRESIDYLLEKVECKKKKYGYDKRMPFKLIRFIDRRKKVK